MNKFGPRKNPPCSTIDVRDLVLYLNNLPLSATFGKPESRANPSSGSAQVTIYFNKPVSGSLRLEFSGTASNGDDYDVGAVGQAPPSANLSTIIRQVALPAGSRSYLLTVPLTPATGRIRAERRLVLSLRSPAVLSSSGVEVTRTGPAPGPISSHTIIIREAEYLWNGYLDFPSETGFGKLPVAFALGADRGLKTSVENSKFFAAPSASQGSVAADGSLVFASSLTGTFQPTFQETGGTAVPASWTLTFIPVQSVSPLPDLFEYTAQLQVSNFPCAGIQRTYSATLIISPSR